MENLKELAMLLNLDLEDYPYELKKEIAKYEERCVKSFLARKAHEKYNAEATAAVERFKETMNALGAELHSSKEEVYAPFFRYTLYDESYDIGF